MAGLDDLRGLFQIMILTILTPGALLLLVSVPGS